MDRRINFYVSHLGGISLHFGFRTSSHAIRLRCRASNQAEVAAGTVAPIGRHCCLLWNYLFFRLWGKPATDDGCCDVSLFSGYVLFSHSAGNEPERVDLIMNPRSEQDGGDRACRFPETETRIRYCPYA